MLIHSTNKTVLSLSAVLVCITSISAVFGQASPGKADPVKEQPAQSLSAASPPSAVPPSNLPSPTLGPHRSRRADAFYGGFWGVQNLQVRETASGSLLRFSYTVVNPQRASVFSDKKATPYLIDEKTGVVLQVPNMPKVGALRQTTELEQGHEYWMVFSNKGVVKPGNRVDVVVGKFRASGLIVQ